MCVDTHHFKCCCSCLSMTSATLILGALYLIGCIMNAVGGWWINFAITLIISLLFVMVLVKPHDIYIRKILYYSVTGMTVINFLGVIIVFIYLLATDDWIDTACNEGTDNYSDYSQCLDYAKTYMIIGMVFVVVVTALLGFCTM